MLLQGSSTREQTMASLACVLLLPWHMPPKMLGQFLLCLKLAATLLTHACPFSRVMLLCRGWPLVSGRAVTLGCIGMVHEPSVGTLVMRLQPLGTSKAGATSAARDAATGRGHASNHELVHHVDVRLQASLTRELPAPHCISRISMHLTAPQLPH
jgi:hypothetical protein